MTESFYYKPSHVQSIISQTHLLGFTGLNVCFFLCYTHFYNVLITYSHTVNDRKQVRSVSF